MLDMGSTSANNIRFFTGKGHKNYSEDLLRSSLDPSLSSIHDGNGNSVIDSKKFLEENLQYPNGQFDVVLCWNLPDYMEEGLVKPTIDRLWSMDETGRISAGLLSHPLRGRSRFDLLSLSRQRYRHPGDAGSKVCAPRTSRVRKTISATAARVQ